MEICYNLMPQKTGDWKLYGFTTENIAGYFSQFNFADKNILTVAGSGDHILNAILLGAKNIDAFDINRNALYFSELKIILAKYLSFDEFVEFFMIDGKNVFDYKIYKKYCLCLSNNARKYFDKLYKIYKNNGFLLRNSDVFNNKYDTRKNKFKYNIYLNKNNFLKLKNNLKNIKINFFESDIKNLKILRQYDIILLSNISDYLLGFGENKLANYFDLICKLKSLNNNVVFGYLYDIENKTKRSEIDEPQKREKYFKNKCYNEFCFESAISGKTDAILILKGE